MTYVPFDKDWYDLGYLEPVFMVEVVGYYNERVIAENPEDYVACWMLDSEQPIMIKRRTEACDPIPREEWRLYWRLTAPLPMKALAVVR